MKKVKLLKPHTHQGVEYPKDTVLLLSNSDAAWCIPMEIAEEEKSAAPAANEKPADDPAPVTTPSSTANAKSQASNQETKA